MNIQSYDSIKKQLGLTGDLPYTPKWSAAPDFLSLILEYCLQHSPETIVECSCGLTTLVLSRCCQLNGHGQVVSLENGEKYAVKTRMQLKDLGLGDYNKIVIAPLASQKIDNKDYQWYGIDRIPDVSIDMLVVDGPPGYMQKYSRYPALPVLYKRFSDRCAVFLDDAARPDEKEIVKLWCKAFVPVDNEYIENERGCSVLIFDKRRL